jgi:hypothetical protein
MSKLTVGALGKAPAMAWDLHVPIVDEHRYVVGSLVAVKRDRIIFVTNSIWAARMVASLKMDGPGTLGGRLVWIPNKAVPSMASELRLYNAAAWIEEARRNIPGEVEKMIPLSLRSLGDHPPEDRVSAHRWGWTKAYNLFWDLFQDPGWEIVVTKRSETRVLVERKFLQEVHR